MDAQTSTNFCIADEADALEIASLVNKAYRPSKEDAGWTHEADLIAGERTSTEQVLSLFHDQSAILVMSLQRRIVACVHVQGGQSAAYIGMLATDPTMQGQGLGKRMLEQAEIYAIEHLGATVLKMSVLSLRPELLAFYQRRGYVLTGETKQYPSRGGGGRPKIDGIRVLFLQKDAETYRS